MDREYTRRTVNDMRISPLPLSGATLVSAGRGEGWHGQMGGYRMIQSIKIATQVAKMALNIRNRETESLAAALAAATGETKTEAVRRALQERLESVRHQQNRRRSLVDEINVIADHCTALTEIDTRSPDAILDYDAQGLPR